MGKPKRKQAMPCPGMDGSCHCESDLDGEDGWVIVKKQRVTILVPPRSIPSAMPRPKPCSVEAMPMKTEGDNSTALIETSVRAPLIDGVEEATIRPASERCNQFERKPRPQSSVRPSYVANETTNATPVNTLRSTQLPGLLGISEAMRQPMVMGGQPHALNGNLVLNWRLRALLLEKKLQRAGGLSKWLESLGLRQFVKMFQGRSGSKFLLANLTMNKLKHMGAEAVGPRRKLIHAIDCICQPCCFQTPKFRRIPT